MVVLYETTEKSKEDLTALRAAFDQSKRDGISDAVIWLVKNADAYKPEALAEMMALELLK